MDIPNFDQTTVLFENAHAKRIAGKSARTGSDYEFFVQEGLLFQPSERWPHHVEIMLPSDRNGTPFSVGAYQVVSRAYADRNKRLAFTFDLVFSEDV